MEKIEILHLGMPLLASMIIAIIEAYLDAQASKKKGAVDHAFSTAMRIVAAGIFTIFFLEVTVHPASFKIAIKILYFILLLIAYWIPFDPFFNLFKHGKDRMWVIHEPDPVHGAITDKWAYNAMGQDGKLYMKTKISIGLLIGITIYILMTL